MINQEILNQVMCELFSKSDGYLYSRTSDGNEANVGVNIDRNMSVSTLSANNVIATKLSSLGPIIMNKNKITGLGNPVNSSDAVTKQFVEDTYVPLEGDVPMHGLLNMNSNQITNVLNPVAPQDVATKNYVDATGATGVWGQFDSLIIIEGNDEETMIRDGFGSLEIQPSQMTDNSRYNFRICSQILTNFPSNITFKIYIGTTPITILWKYIPLTATDSTYVIIDINLIFTNNGFQVVGTLNSNVVITNANDHSTELQRNIIDESTHASIDKQIPQMINVTMQFSVINTAVVKSLDIYKTF